jgi:hypothetical protein
VFSHETALWLHGLSDTMPAKAHITLPGAWNTRRLRVPGGIAMHFSDIKSDDRTWFGAVPVTAVGRTLNDCTDVSVAPEFVRDAFAQAAHRGLVEPASLPNVVSYLKPFFPDIAEQITSRRDSDFEEVKKRKK